MIADIWSAAGRGPATSAFTAAVFIGPVIGPIVSGLYVYIPFFNPMEQLAHFCFSIASFRVIWDGDGSSGSCSYSLGPAASSPSSFCPRLMRPSSYSKRYSLLFLLPNQKTILTVFEIGKESTQKRSCERGSLRRTREARLVRQRRHSPHLIPPVQDARDGAGFGTHNNLYLTRLWYPLRSYVPLPLISHRTIIQCS